MASAEADLHGKQYGGHVRPSNFAMYQVFTRKTFVVAWRRWRLQLAMIMPSLHGAVHLAVWILCDSLLENGEWKAFKGKVLLTVFRTVTPLFLAMSMKTVLEKMVQELVTEKESKMKAVQLVNGLPPSIYWLSYVTYFLCSSFIPVLAWSIMLCATCFSGCNFILVFLMLYVSFVHIFFVSVAIAAVFDKAKTAGTLSGGILALAFLPIGLTYLETIPAFVVLILGFFPPCALVFWTQSLLMLSVKDEFWGFNDNFFQKATTWSSDTFGVKELPSPGLIFLLSLAQITVGGLLAYWLDQVVQGEHGAAQTCCFCLKRRKYQSATSQLSAQLPGKSDVEAPADDRWATERIRPLEISHLTKTFRRVNYNNTCKRQVTLQTAVDDVSLDVKASELFALLGHNGAGKTTLINCVSGMIPLTSGDVKVLGMSCIADIVSCRWNMSICPQDNPMYEEMTVDEHLLFFSELRGSQKAHDEVSQVLEALGLLEKRMAKCGTLSGGQKRRLWVATSLLGDAPLVFLDEPTSGMDPSSRRELWTLLLSMKGRGRSILFTTHYLEEADLLADRKAILAKGKVKAMGTSKELKMQFGTGYHLRIMTPHSAPAYVPQRLTELVTELVAGAAQEHVPDVERTQSTDAPMELRYTLPYSAVDSFGPLFLAIEAQTEELQVIDFELAMTSLEEVFMALGKDGDAESSDLEFQALEQEQDGDERLSLSTKDYMRVLWRFRTEQVTSSKRVLFGTVFFPILFTAYAVLSSTGFGANPGKLMANNFAMFPGFIGALASVCLVYTMIEEREKKIRHVMISMGLPRRVYWNVTLSHNALQVAFIMLCIPLALHIAGEKCLGEGRAVFVWLAALLHCIPMSLYFYLMTFCFTRTENASKLINLINLIFGMFLIMVPGICWNFGLEGTTNMVGTLVHTLFSFMNPYYLLPGVLLGVWRAGGGDPQSCDDLDTRENAPSFNECRGIPEGAGFDYFAGTWVFWAPWVGQAVLSIALYGIACWMSSPKKQWAKHAEDRSDDARRDEDVMAEAERVRDTQPEKEACLYRGLHHVYQDKERSVHAVRGISLGIQHGECFGLLGPNGAGKTTTLGCLTGELRPPTAGEVYVAGHSVTGHGIEEAYKHLGYCPQIDPIFEESTGRKHLLLYGAMKGIPANELPQVVDNLFQRLGFDVPDRDKLAKQYSGGMKRKLSLAMALIGPSTVLFLDEPSAAVDAGAKRLLWQAIKMRAPSKTVVITTHSMEEAEAVCDRIAIQVKGALRCLGTPLHLKTTYGSGYQLEIRLKKSQGADMRLQAGRLTEFIQSAFSSKCQLLEAHEEFYVYQLPRFTQGGLSLGSVFTKLQQDAQSYDIDEYTMSQPTLEQVFLRFAKEQQLGDSNVERVPSFHTSKSSFK